MRLLYPIIYLLLFVTGAFAQGSRTFVFPVSAAEVESLYRAGPTADLDFLLPRAAVDTLDPGEPAGRYATGHYLLVTAQAEQLRWSVHTVSPHQAFVRTVGKELVLSVVDESGTRQLPARALLDGRPLRPHPADTTYRRRAYRGDWLRIELPGDTLFYRVTEAEKRSRFHRRLVRWGRSPVVTLVLTPFRWADNSIQYLLRGVRQGNWRVYTWPGQRLYHRLFGNNRPDFRGYIATNQPTYRPGDTLRLVANVTRQSGRPWRRGLRLDIGRYRDRFVDTLLQPVASGRYVFTTVIGDSIKLDRDYAVRLAAPGRRDPRHLATRIRVEDYELDEYTLSVAAPPAFDDHEPVALDVTVADVNGQAVIGSELDVILRSRTVQRGYADRFVLPDTLWRRHFAMDERTTLTVLVPDSLLPPARLDLVAEVRYTGPSGQQRTVERAFTVTREPAAPRLRLEEDSLLLTTTEPDTVAPAELWLHYPGLPPRRQAVTLPQRLPVNPAISRYTLQYRNKTATLEVARETAGVELRTTWRADSLVVAIANPRRLPVDWSVRGPGGQFRTGSTRAAHYRTTLPIDLDRTQLWLAWRYPWGGAMEDDERTIYNAANQLDVALQLPARAYPGQTVPVSIAVADRKGRPQTGVPVALGSYNARFERTPYTVPEISQRRKREPLTWQQFGADRYRGDGYDSVARAWVEPLVLHDSTFYRLLLPSAPLYREYLPLSRQAMPDTTLAQLSPYVVRDGAREAIHLIYLDRDLIYFAAANGDTPYAFAARSGYHRLTLRTARSEYRLDSVWLRPGHRLVLGIDAHRREAIPNLVTLPQSSRLTDTEQARLQRRIFAVRSLPGGTRSGGYLWQDSLRIYAVNQTGGDRWVGLFDQGPPVQVHTPTTGRVALRFEPGFSYAVDTIRDRLYAIDPAPRLAKMRLGTASPRPAFGQSAWFPGTLPRRPSARVWTLPAVGALPGHFSGRARLALGGLPADVYRILLLRDDRPERVTEPTNLIGQLPAGDYRVWLLYADRTGRELPVTLAANAITYRQLDTNESPRGPIPSYVEEQLDAKWLLSLSHRLNTGGVNRRPAPGRYAISGYVRDTDGEPMIGASVWVEGTTIGTVTDLDGAYRLFVDDPEVQLVFSYTGYSSLTVAAAAGEAVDVDLAPSSYALDEVVVVGGGRLRKRSLTAAAVQGRTAGLTAQGAHSTREAYAVNGSELGGSLEAPELPAYAGPRTAFRDYAAWRPLLLTDRDGRVKIDLTLPDDITAWNSFALATDRRQAGLGLARTQVYLPLQAQLYLPRFLVAGDRSEAIGLAVNRTGTPLSVTPAFGPPGAVRAQDQRQLDRGAELFFPIVAPAVPTDSLAYTFELTAGGSVGDGERRTLPVYPRGTVTTRGWMQVLDTAYAETAFGFDAAGDSVTVRVYGNQLAQLENELAYLQNYPYLCHEQTASRLIALLAYARIEAARAEISSELERDIRSMIERLRKGRNPDGGWGWWPGGGSSPWISVHVERAFRWARRQGWTATPDSTETYRFLRAELPGMRDDERLATLLFFAEAGLALDYAAEMSPPRVSGPPKKLHAVLLRTRIRQLAGLPFSLDTLANTRRRTLTGADHWEEAGYCGYAPYRHAVGNSLLAYQILRDAGREEAAARARRYLLEGQFVPQPGARPRLGHNTYEAARLIHELLPGLLAEDAALQPATATLETATGRTIAVADPPWVGQLAPREATALTWRKSGAGPLFVAAYQRRFDPDPPARTDPFAVRTAFYQEEQTVERLRNGTPATLRTRVTVAADAEYVLIEIPIPAGCGYGEKIFRESGYETHREYRRDRVAIFCTRLPAGVHTFTVPLEPRFRGDYHLNPARAEMMYLPVFSGNNGVRKVAIE